MPAITPRRPTCSRRRTRNPRVAKVFSVSAWRATACTSWMPPSSPSNPLLNATRNRSCPRTRPGRGPVQKGNPNEALAVYSRILNLEPANISALRGAAAIYLHGKIHNKAVEVLEQLIRLAPSDPQLHADLGSEYVAIGKSGRRRKSSFKRPAPQTESIRPRCWASPTYISEGVKKPEPSDCFSKWSRSFQRIRASFPAGLRLQSAGPLPGCTGRTAACATSRCQ